MSGKVGVETGAEDEEGEGYAQSLTGDRDVAVFRISGAFFFVDTDFSAAGALTDPADFPPIKSMRK